MFIWFPPEQVSHTGTSTVNQPTSSLTDLQKQKVRRLHVLINPAVKFLRHVSLFKRFHRHFCSTFNEIFVFFISSNIKRFLFSIKLNFSSSSSLSETSFTQKCELSPVMISDFHGEVNRPEALINLCDESVYRL